jgi:hypothetical protein
MIFNYYPTNKIVINEIALEFGLKRELVRSKLAENYKAEDEIIDLGSSIIHKKRDVYQNISSTENLFFLGYNFDNSLRDVEVHHCNQIKVLDIIFDFDQSLDSIAVQLSKYSSKWKKNDGNYFFEDLKMVICDQDQMGGERNTLGYFYCSSDLTHLRNIY